MRVLSLTHFAQVRSQPLCASRACRHQVKTFAMKATWEGATIAESNETVVVENNHYFPPSAIKKEYFQDSNTHTTCGWKGVASYYNVVVGDKVNKDAAWYYPSCSDAAKKIEGYVAFWKGVKVSENEESPGQQYQKPAVFDVFAMLLSVNASAPTCRFRTATLVAASQTHPQKAYTCTFGASTRPNQRPGWVSKLLKGALLTSVGAATLAGSLALSPPALARTEAPQDPPNAQTISMPWSRTPNAVAAVPATMESKLPIPSPDYLSPDELATVRLFQENTPCVVNISNIVAARAPFSTDVFKIPQGQGSGFIWPSTSNGGGIIVTNYHVVRGAAEVRVTLVDQTVWKAKILGGDPSKDVAVLQLEAPVEVLKNLKPVTLGQSSGLFVGQKVYAIGNPFALDHSLSNGIISGLNRELSAGGPGPSLRNCIQTDAAINPGNSGGPLLDSRGRLIGINTAIADPSGRGSFSGVGFAVPIDTVKGLVDQILKYGRVVRPVLGVTIAPPQALRQLGLEGVLILDVPRGSPAAKAGLQGIAKDSFGRLVLGDVIVGFNGQPVKKEGDLFDMLDKCKVGDSVKVDVLRQGEKKVTVTVVLAERAPEPSE